MLYPWKIFQKDIQSIKDFSQAANFILQADETL